MMCKGGRGDGDKMDSSAAEFVAKKLDSTGKGLFKYILKYRYCVSPEDGIMSKHV